MVSCFVHKLKFLLNHRGSIVASENGEKPSSTQQMDILSVQEVRSQYLLLRDSAQSRGDHWQKPKLITSVTILITADFRTFVTEQKPVLLGNPERINVQK